MAEALYRTYRPQVFSDVVGQDHIVRTLQNAVEQGKVSHAYLFCGPRGTGKTTMARLLSKALLCGQGATANPDGTCEDCRLIAAGTHPDVYELDAASRTGVENVREEIIGRVQFAPTRGASKVYIIDEVHMLSTAAFNALLKTLEEPPSHVVFVLCTTDPQKVPETIHSRCQRFDFRRIGQEAMVAKLGAVCVAEGARFEGEALELVAHRAEGGMRNALTALEQLMAFSGGNVTLAAAEDMLGGLDASDVAELVAAIGVRDAGACFAWIARYVETGGDLAQFARDLAEHLRNLYVMSLAGTDVPLDVSDATRGQMVHELQWFGSDRLARALCVLGDLMGELKTSTNARLSFEIACVRLTRPATDLTLESLAERIESLERNGVVAQRQPAVAQPDPAAQPQTTQQSPIAERASAAQQQVTRQVAEARNQTPIAQQQAARQQVDRQQPAQQSTQSDVAHRTLAEQQMRATVQQPDQGQPAHQTQQQPQQPQRDQQQPQEAGDQTMVGGQADKGDAWEKAAQNPASLQRLWAQVMGALKKDKGPYAVLFMNTRVSFDGARKVLCVEFPKEAAFAYKAVQKPEVSESLTAAIVATLGVPAPFCYVQTGGAKPSIPGGQGGAQAQEQRVQAHQSPAQQTRVLEQSRREEATPQEQPHQQRPHQEQPRQIQSQQERFQQVQRERSSQAPQRPSAGSASRDDGYDEVPLDLYDGFAAPQDDRYGDFESFDDPRRDEGGRGTKPAAQKPTVQPQPAPQRDMPVPTQEAPSPTAVDPAADGLWRGNLEDAFGPLTVQRL